MLKLLLNGFKSVKTIKNGATDDRTSKIYSAVARSNTPGVILLRTDYLD